MAVDIMQSYRPRICSDTEVDYSSPSSSPLTVDDDFTKTRDRDNNVVYYDPTYLVLEEEDYISDPLLSVIDNLFQECIYNLVNRREGAEQDLKDFSASVDFKNVSEILLNRSARCATITGNTALLTILLTSSRKTEITEDNTNIQFIYPCKIKGII